MNPLQPSCVSEALPEPGAVVSSEAHPSEVKQLYQISECEEGRIQQELRIRHILVGEIPAVSCGEPNLEAVVFASAGSGADVAADCGREIEDAVAQKPGAVGNVEVLEIGEVRDVEEPGFFKGGKPVERRARAGGEDEGGTVPVLYRLLQTALKLPAEEGVLVAGIVHHGAVVHFDHAGADGEELLCAILFHFRLESFEEVRKDRGVIVQQQDIGEILRRRTADAEVDCGGKTEILWISEQETPVGCLRAPMREPMQALVGGSVVDDDCQEVLSALPVQCLHTGRQEAVSVVVRDDNGGFHRDILSFQKEGAVYGKWLPPLLYQAVQAFGSTSPFAASCSAASCAAAAAAASAADCWLRITGSVGS